MPLSGTVRRHSTLALPFAVHAGLALWALQAWIAGPFGGAPVVDGAEVVALARGEADGFVTKSPLYPALLGICGTGPWMVGALGVLLSLAAQAFAARLAWRLGGRRAALAAAWVYASVGGTYAFLVQPLPAVPAAALLAAMALGLEHAGAGRARGWWWAGVAAGLAVLTRAPLALAVLVAMVWVFRRGRVRGLAAFAGATAVVLLVGSVAFGERVWPEGGAFNLRLGNSGLRSGTTEVRPGPLYEQWRYDEVFDARPGEGRSEYHLARLGEECAEDPLGAVGTLARKAWLSVQPTEIVSAADFRHGLEGFAPFSALEWAWAWLVPLGVAGIVAHRRAALIWPLAGVLLANVVVLTCARYRFPAVPLLSAAAGLGLAAVLARPRDRSLWASMALAAGVAWIPWARGGAARWVVPGDGLVQEAHLRLGADPTRRDPAVGALLARALDLGSEDPRGAYLEGLWHEKNGRFDRAIEAYDRALARAPRFAQAAENRLRAMVQRSGFDAEARAFAEAAMARIPHAGQIWLATAELDPRLDESERRSRAARGAEIMGLRARAEGR